MEKIIKPTALLFILIAISQMCICQEIKQKSSNETTFDNDREAKEKKTASFINQKNEDVKVNEAMIRAYQNSTSETDEISFLEFMRDNPEDFSVKYQAYMRTRLAENTDSMRQILYTEMAKIKNEMNDDNVDYTKLVYKDTQAPDERQSVLNQAMASTVKDNQPNN